MTETIGQRIKRVRKLLGLSQEKVEKLGGPSRVTISRLESGVEQQPEQYTVRRLAEVLHVNPHWLLTGEGPMEPTVLQSPGPAEVKFTTLQPSVEIREVPSSITGTAMTSQAVQVQGASGTLTTVARQLAIQALSNLVSELEEEDLPNFLESATRAASIARIARDLNRRAQEGQK